jgi:hypothetical protein
MRSWESARHRGKLRHGLPGLHGPSEHRTYQPMVDDTLTGQPRGIVGHAWTRSEKPAIHHPRGPISPPASHHSRSAFGPALHTRLATGRCRRWPGSSRTGSGARFRQLLPSGVAVLDDPCDPGRPSGAPARGLGFPRSHGPSEERFKVPKVKVSLVFRCPTVASEPSLLFRCVAVRSDPAPQAGARRDRRRAPAAGRRVGPA